jgi:hypothetical protein
VEEKRHMTTIAILPESPGSPTTVYRAVAGNKQSVGQSAGQALDALTAQLSEAEGGTLLVVQHQRPDRFFTAAQQQRLEELMTRWRTARDSGTSLPAAEQAELEALVEAELTAATERTRALIHG